MNIHQLIRKHRCTAFVRVEPSRCEACSACINACSRHVLGLTPIPWHHHVRVVDAAKCKGCKLCIEACTQGAITPVTS